MKAVSARRAVAVMAGSTMLTGLCAVGLVHPAQAAETVAATVADMGADALFVRSGPGAGYGVVTEIAAGTSVDIECQTDGDTVEGNKVWDYLPEYGGYSSDRYLNTPGHDGRHPELSECGDTAPPDSAIGEDISQIAQGELGNTDGASYHPGQGSPDDAWCQYFVNWVWGNAGVSNMYSADGFTGNFYWWAVERGLVRDGYDGIQVGDALLFGTGPENPDTSLHVGIVVAVNGDGSVETVDGNYADSVARVGPYFPGSATTHEPGNVYAVVAPE